MNDDIDEAQKRLLICNDLGMSLDDFSLEPKEEDLKIRSTEYLKAKKSIAETPELSRSPDMSFTKKKSLLES